MISHYAHNRIPGPWSDLIFMDSACLCHLRGALSRRSCGWYIVGMFRFHGDLHGVYWMDPSSSWICPFFRPQETIFYSLLVPPPYPSCLYCVSRLLLFNSCRSTAARYPFKLFPYWFDQEYKWLALRWMFCWGLPKMRAWLFLFLNFVHGSSNYPF